MNVTRARDCTGLYIITTAVAILALLLLCALAFTAAYLSTNRIRLQNISNLAAIAALERFVQLSGDQTTCPPDGNEYLCKANHALTRANEIVSQNSLWGTYQLLGDLSHNGADGEGGEMTLGYWYQDRPTGRDPCHKEYPCFVANDPPTEGMTANANAARIMLSNQSDNPIVVPWANLLGEDHFWLDVSATSTLVPRCIAMIADLSYSTVRDTHRSKFPPTIADQGDGANPRYTIEDPDGPIGLFAMLDVPPDGSNNSLSTDCSDAGSYDTYDDMYWCNMPLDRSNPGDENPNDPLVHFRTDFSHRDTRYGRMMVDTYSNPEPLSTYFMSFNIAARTLWAQGSPGDKAMLIAMRGSIDPNWDVVPPGGASMTSDFRYLTQITNLDNRGRTGATPTAEIHPNILDYGWVPASRATSSETNLYAAFRIAIDAIEANCSEESKKIIIVTGDGLGNCIGDVCEQSMDWYVGSYRRLFGERGKYNGISILEELIARHIAVTSIVSGEYVGPNFLNRESPYIDQVGRENCFDSSGHPLPVAKPECFMDFMQAAALGYGFYGSGNTDPKQVFFDYTACARSNGQEDCDDAIRNYGDSGDSFDEKNDKFFRNLGSDPNITYHHPSTVLLGMSLQTSGIACPLMPKHPTPGAYVDGVLRNDFRPYQNRPDGDIKVLPLSRQMYAIEDRTKSQQAARCVEQSIGLNPYILVEEPATKMTSDGGAQRR